MVRPAPSPSSAAPAEAGDHASEGLAARDRRTIWVASAVAAVVLVAFTLTRIDRYGLSLDEAFSLGATHQLPGTVRTTGATMALYYTLLTPWTYVSREVWWLRSLSLVFAVASLPVIAVVAFRLGGRRVAVAAPLVCALTYMFALKAYELRTYSLEILFTAVAWYCLVRVVSAGPDDRSVRNWWWLLSALIVLGPFTHGLFALGVLAMAASLLLAPEPWPLLRRLVPAGAGMLASFGFMGVLGIRGVGAWVAPTHLDTVGYALLHLTSTARPVAVGVYALMAIGWVRGVVVAVRSRRPGTDREVRLRGWLALVPMIWTVVPFVALLLLSEVRPTFIDRYLAPVAPGVAISACWGAVVVHDGIRRLLRRHDRRAALVGVPMVVLVLALVGSQPAVANGNREDWREVARMVADGARPGDGLVLTSVVTRSPFEAAWAEVSHPVVPTVIDGRRQLGRVSRIETWLPPKTTRAAMARYDRIWVVTRFADKTSREFVGRPPLNTEFRRVDAGTFYSQFDGQLMVVLLYERIAPPGSG